MGKKYVCVNSAGSEPVREGTEHRAYTDKNAAAVRASNGTTSLKSVCTVIVTVIRGTEPRLEMHSTSRKPETSYPTGSHVFAQGHFKYS